MAEEKNILIVGLSNRTANSVIAELEPYKGIGEISNVVSGRDAIAKISSSFDDYDLIIVFQSPSTQEEAFYNELNNFEFQGKVLFKGDRDNKPTQIPNEDFVDAEASLLKLAQKVAEKLGLQSPEKTGFTRKQ